MAVKLAKGKPIIAKEELDNGRVKVPSVFLDVISVTKENLLDTVVKDGLHKREALFGK